MEMSARTFAKNLRFLRRSRGITQTLIADYVGKKTNTISNWENELTEPAISEILKLSEFFNIPISDLLTSDLEKGKVIEKSDDQKKQEKGKVKGKVSGKLNTENDDFSKALESEQSYGNSEAVQAMKDLTEEMRQLRLSFEEMNKKKG